MKYFVIVVLIATFGLNLSAEVDLDYEFFGKTNSHYLIPRSEIFGIRPPLDLTPGFPSIVNQSP